MLPKYTSIFIGLIVLRLLLVGAPILLEPFHPPVAYGFLLLNIVATIVGIVGAVRGKMLLVNLLVIVAVLDSLLRIFLTVMMLIPQPVPPTATRMGPDHHQRPGGDFPSTDGNPHPYPIRDNNHRVIQVCNGFILIANIATILFSRKLSPTLNEPESREDNENDSYDEDDMDIEMALRGKLMHEYASVETQERPQRKRRGTKKSKKRSRKQKKRSVESTAYRGESEDALYDEETPAAVDPESGATN
eukprot:TRINITY_DN5929_c0_g1_i1.p1 TRINITY_DN5929_c0_g1~~TRINITY_DN5929_c0_g1_i1.p1  ORF type:complete len:246 (+),score=33.79 TRINITY_DN5929_c0_g1_i1:238-975(+)